MPRRLRNWVDNSCYHITHRCEDKNFYFKFKKYRDKYRHFLFEGQKRYKVDILNFVVTSNHVHILVVAGIGSNISKCIQFAHSRIAQVYNQEKGFESSFWNGRFHATRIEDGNHLSRCLFYIDFNMVRAGVVKHPSEWEHGGYHEIIHDKARYRIVNVERLMRCLKMANASVEDLRNWYSRTLTDMLQKEQLKREAFWSEAFAVGSKGWLSKAAEESGLKQYHFYENENTEYILGKNNTKNLKRCF